MTTTPRDEAIGYGRVSTETQLDGFGLDIQRDAITDAAELDELELVAVFTDEGISGSEGLETRRGLAAALDHLIEHPGTTIIIPRLDRLARDLMVQESILADIWKAGGIVRSCSETERAYCHPDDPSDPARTLIRQVLGAVSAYERAMIRLRMVRGRRRKIVEMGWAGGITPYGWIDPHEQAVLSHIAARRAAGATWRGLAEELAAQGITQRNGKRWTHQTLHAVFSRAMDRGPIAPRELAS
jgi:DNA invertase Pin-like site-specific DNA recombinase